MNADAIETALEVLAWLSEVEDDGRLRDEIGHIRSRLADWFDDLAEEES